MIPSFLPMAREKRVGQKPTLFPPRGPCLSKDAFGIFLDLAEEIPTRDRVSSRRSSRYDLGRFGLEAHYLGPTSKTVVYHDLAKPERPKVSPSRSGGTSLRDVTILRMVATSLGCCHPGVGSFLPLGRGGLDTPSWVDPSEGRG